MPGQIGDDDIGWASVSGGGGGGSGTVTSITAGTGLSGGTITTSGTIALANSTANTLAGYNNSGVFSDVTIGTGLTLSGGTLTASGAVTSVSNSDGTLTISPTTGAVVASLAALTSTNILVGNGSNIATGVALSGDATLANTGALTIAAGAITNAKLANMAASYTVKANPTTAAAAPQDIIYPSLIANGLAPNQFSGLTGWWAADQVINTTDGATVSSLPDLSGNGFTMTNAAVTKNPPIFLKSGLNNKPALQFVNGGTMALGNTSVPLNKGAFTMVCVVDCDISNGFPVFMSYITTLFGMFNNAGTFDFNNGSLIASGQFPLTPGPSVYVVTYDGSTTLKFRINGVETLVTISATSGSVTGFMLGYGTSTFYGTGTYGEWALYSRALSSSTECPKLEAFLMSKYNVFPIPVTQKPLVVFDGNSVMQGVRLTNMCNAISNKVMSQLPQGIQFVNYSFAGAGTSALTTRATTLIDPLYSAKRTQNIIVFLEGYNDPSVTDYEAYVNARLTAGWKVVLLTPMSNNIQTDANRITFNAALRTYYNAHPTWQAGVVLADCGNDPYMGLTGEKADTTYIYTDQTHPIDFGSVRAATVHTLPALGEALGLSTINRQFVTATVDNTATWIKYIPVNTAHVFLSGAGSTAGTSYALTLQCAAQRIDTGGTDSAYFEQRYLVNVSTAGAVTLTNVGVNIAEQTGFTAAALTASANGQGVFVQVTGETAKTVAWTLRYDIAGTN